MKDFWNSLSPLAQAGVVITFYVLSILFLLTS